MKRAKKIMALVLSLALALNSSMLVLAEEPQQDEAKTEDIQAAEMSEDTGETPAMEDTGEAAITEEAAGEAGDVPEEVTDGSETEAADENKAPEAEEPTKTDKQPEAEEQTKTDKQPEAEEQTKTQEQPAKEEKVDAQAAAGDVELNAANFPDEAFREFIRGEADGNQDGILSTEEIANVTELAVNDEALGIRDMTGIRYFTELQILQVLDQSVAALDLSANVKLHTLVLDNNALTELNLTGVTNLETLILGPQNVGDKKYDGWSLSGKYDGDNDLLWPNDDGDISQVAGQKIHLVQNDFKKLAIDVPNNKMSLYIGTQGSMSVIPMDDYATQVITECSWSIDEANPGIVTVNSDESVETATVKGIAAGTTTVTATIGKYKASCVVTVEAGRPEGIQIGEETFPDEAFRDYVQNTIDLNKDTILTKEEIAECTSINVWEYRTGENDEIAIRDLTGIGYFTELETLDCSSNNLTALDLSANEKLSTLVCNDNMLTTLNLDNNTKLESLECEKNELTVLNLTNNKELGELYCDYNHLETLDLSGKSAEFGWYGSGYQIINGVLCKEWYYDQAFEDPVEEMSAAVGKVIYLKPEEQSGLQVVPDSVTLGLLDRCQIQVGMETEDGDMDFDNLPDDMQVSVRDTTIAEVEQAGDDEQKGTYVIIPLNIGSTKVMFSTETYSATCSITVRDGSVAVEVNAENFPDADFRSAVSEFIDGDGDGTLSLEEQLESSWLEAGGKCSSIQGIEKLPYLSQIFIHSAFLKDADFTGCDLNSIEITSPILENLNISGLTNLMNLDLRNARKLGDIDFAQFPNLETLVLGGKNMTKVDVTKNPELGLLALNNVPITSLDLSGNSGLETLELNNVPIASLDLSGNSELINLLLDNVPITKISTANAAGLERIAITRSGLESIDLKKNKELLNVKLSNTMGGETGWFTDESYTKPWTGDVKTALSSVLYRNPDWEEPVYDSPTYTEFDDPTYEDIIEGDNSYGVNGLKLGDGFIYGKLSTGILEEVSSNRKLAALLERQGIDDGDYKLLQASGVYRKNDKTDTSAAQFSFLGDEINTGDTIEVLRRTGTKADDTWERINEISVSENEVVVNADKIGLPFIVVKRTVERRNFTKSEVTGIEDMTYTGSAIKQSGLKVTYKGNELKEGTDYEVTYSANKNPGTATITLKGIGIYSGEISRTFTISVAEVEGLKTSAEKAASMKLEWEKLDNVTGYRVQYCTDDDFKSGVVTKVISTNTNVLNVTKLTAGSTYYYRVRAFVTVSGSPKYGSYSDTYEAVTATATPAAPKVSGVTGRANVKVTWKSVSGASSYELLQATSAKGEYNKIAELSASTLSYTVTEGLSYGRTYYYKVRTSREGNKYNVYSEESGYGYSATAPSTPRITKIEGGTKQVKLTWTKSSGASKYVIYQDDEIIATLSSSTLTNTVTGLAAGRTYGFKVRAYRSNVASSSSAEIFEATAPEEPTIKNILNGEELEVTWGAVSGASGYRVYMSTSASSGYKLVDTLEGKNAVTYTATGLDAATRYYFKVRSYRTGNDSQIYAGYSGIKYGETPAEVPQISSLRGGSKQITIKWKDVSNEDGYEIYRSVYATRSFTKLATLTEDKVSYVDKSLAQGKKYYYRVCSYRTIDGSKLYSELGTVEGTATTPAAPAIVSAKAAETQATVSWKAVSGVSGYDIYMATSSTGTYSKKVRVSGSSKTSGVVKNLTPGKKYYFRVKAYISASGEFTTTNSAFSGTKYCTIQK
ncbi:fibronectin type III domain-containing protein [Hespellia stercorisuis]|uniref:Fibronectin type III domain-containing protein n=1 Tax=Hespellia stercorisuis DSM 15480 TaxID=1121950 RepID=A0A1M6TEX8_9FIRM|nr:fibronectin type III domain-containing protein [Hespellia stercorisuis]SHK55511.1 Fibronectin type III domain-containing protein [Hespellia stercorisuis DSM 15480]